MLDTLNKPFVQYERAMGLPESLIVWKYMLRNALTSTVTQIGLVSGALLGGAVVVEAVFDWPGPRLLRRQFHRYVGLQRRCSASPSGSPSFTS
jgi:ABC-type dipeptide/oligopeptide/nickel transport system permease component